METNLTVGEKISRSMLGNQNARQPARLISDTLRKIAIQEPNRLRTLCDKMMTKAEDDVQAFREIADRIEGKVITQVSISSTNFVIDAALLSEAGKLLQLISGDATLPTPCEIVDPEALEEASSDDASA
jgi:hypothetical protein